MRLSRLLLLCLMVLCAGNIRAGDNYVRDSLLIRLESMPDNELRLKTLYNLVRATQDDMQACQQYNNQLLGEATKQGNDDFRCKAYFTEVVFAYNTHDTKQLRKITDILIPLARKMKYYGTMFRAWRCKIDFMILTQDLESNEQEANKMLAEALRVDNKTGILEAYQCFANIYSATYRKADAIAILEKALVLARTTDNLNHLKAIWQPLLSHYSDTGDYPKWIKLLNEAEARIQQLAPDQLRMQHLFLLIVYSSYTEYYTQIGNLERAEYYMHRADAYLNDSSSPLYIIYFEKSCSQFYFKSGQYEKALERLDVAIEQLRKMDTEEDYYGILPEKARILNKMHRYPDAIVHLREAIAFKDSLQVVTINKQYEQLKRDFNTDQLKIEKAELRHRTQVYTLTLLAIGFVVIIGFIIYLLRCHRILRSTEQKMREMNHQMELVNQAKNRFLSNISTTIREPLNIVVEGSLRLAGRQICDPEEQQQLSEDIRQKAANLLTVINDILDLSRLEAGMMKFETIDAEATSLFFDAVCQWQDAQNKIDVVSEYPKSALYMLRLDANRLMQVFKSLLTADREQVTAHIQEQEAGQLQIKVSGSRLASKRAEQEIIIRNEINRMLITHFGGRYTIQGQEITLLLPVTEKMTI